VAGVFVLAALSACGSSDADPKSAPTTSPAITSSPTAETTSPSPSSPSDAATADATALVRSYFTVLDTVRSDPTSAVGRLSSVATSTQLTADKRLVTRERSQGLHQTGVTSIADLVVQSVNLDNSDPPAGRVPTATIDVCWDVSGADLVDKTGASVVSSERVARGWTRYTVANYHWSAKPSGGWRIASSQDLKQAPCAAS